MKKIILSSSVIVFVTALIIGATGAFFSDTETSTGNTFTAGSIDLLVDSQAHYAGLECISGTWQDDPDVVATTTRPDLVGDECVGTWAMTDLGPGHTFFNLGDLKPGDEGENTISLHVDNNDAYVCAIVDNLTDSENGVTEPEEDEGDTATSTGELSSELRFFAWADMGAIPGFQSTSTSTTTDPTEGDNIWQAGEPALFTNTEGPASDVLGGESYELFGPDTAALPGGTTAFVGLYWCYGDIDASVPGTLTCDGEPVTNMSQTDSMTANISFYVEQARNNDDFECPLPDGEEPGPGPQGPFVGAALSTYDEPEGEACDVTATTTINAAIAAASSGDTVCVPDGTYTENVIVDKGINLAGSGATSTSEINGDVTVQADDATVQGFEINGHVIVKEFSDTRIAHNKVTITAGGTAIGYGPASGGAVATTGQAIIEHNVVSAGTQRGIYLDQNGVNDYLVRFNTVDARKNGFGSQSSGTFTRNVFDGYDQASGAGVEVSHSSGDVAPVVSMNNFNETSTTTAKAVDNNGAESFDAPDNWWGQAGGPQGSQTEGPVTASSPEAAPYDENI